MSHNDPHRARAVIRGRGNRLLALLCALLALARVDGAHLHLCTDGNEAPVAVHAVDVLAHHADEHASAVHADLDLPFAGDAAPRQVDQHDDTAIAQASHRFVAPSPAAGTPRIPCLAALPVPAPRHLTPPACGPPRLQLA